MVEPLVLQQAIAVIDDRTSICCLHVAGQIQPVGADFETLEGDMPSPPFHHSCRTIVVPWRADLIDDLAEEANAELQRRPIEDRDPRNYVSIGRPVERPRVVPAPVRGQEGDFFPSVGRDAVDAAHVSLDTLFGGSTSAVNVMGRQALERQATIVPTAVQQVQGYRAMNATERARFGPDTYVAYDAKTRKILVNDTVMSPQAAAAFRNDVRSQWVVPAGQTTTAGTAAVTHEFGHHMQALLSPAGTKDVWSGVAEAFGIPAPSAFDQATLSRWTRKHRGTLGSVSRLAATGPGEFLAEVWAEYSLNPAARPFVRQIGARLAQAVEG